MPSMVQTTMPHLVTVGVVAVRWLCGPYYKRAEAARCVHTAAARHPSYSYSYSYS